MRASEYIHYLTREDVKLGSNVKKHEYNLANNIGKEDLLWQPDFQEAKESQYGSRNIRYRYGIKREMIELFKSAHKRIIPWNTIRYIF